MSIKHRTAGWMPLAASALLAVALTGTALGQHARERPGAPRAGARERSAARPRYDWRSANSQHYYHRGYRLHSAPAGSVGVLRGPRGGRYWYHRGNWLRWHDGAWVAWGAPIGVFVPWLPPYFTTIWWYGVPYYYANDTYYIWDDIRSEYQVAAPPQGIEQGATVQAPPSDRLFVYPDKGQSAAQQSTDEYECHRWAVAQSGFDPTQPGGGVPTSEAAQKRDDYFRADAACLEGRGYTVR